MLSSSDTSLEEVVRFLARKGVQAGFLAPTPTGLRKKILDAHAQVRSYLKARGFHDYEKQAQGLASRVRRRAWLVGEESHIESRVSLNRPPSGNGDPRIWIRDLPKYCRPNNLLAVFAIDSELFVVNCSSPGILKSADSPHSPFGSLLLRLSSGAGHAANDLLEKLKAISSEGFLPTRRSGSTGVGKTLESLLGIPDNSEKTPDYRGIELKAYRVGEKGKPRNRGNIFTKVPDWSRSPMTDSDSLFRRFCYERNGRWNLNCSVQNKPNRQGLFLAVDKDDLVLKYRGEHRDERLAVWSLADLQEALQQKHPETFWVKARTKLDANGTEMFHYIEVEHTKEPLVANLEMLLETGQVQVDLIGHLVERKRGGGLRVRHHGFPFKFKARSKNLLFPSGKTFSLTTHQ